MKIFGHKIPLKVEGLLYDVLDLYPDKPYIRIAPYSYAADDLGEEIIPENKAMAQPAVSQCIAIWIKEDLEENEFSATLAEELIHHAQAKRGIPMLPRFFGIDKFNDGHIRAEQWADNILRKTAGVIMDLDAYVQLRAMSPALFLSIRNCTLTEFEEALDGLSSSIQNTKTAIENLPTYLLWYWNLSYLGTKFTQREFTRLEKKLFSQCSDQVVEFYNRIKSRLEEDIYNNTRVVSGEVEMILEQMLGISNIKIRFDNGRTTGNECELNNDKELVCVVDRRS